MDDPMHDPLEGFVPVNASEALARADVVIAFAGATGRAHADRAGTIAALRETLEALEDAAADLAGRERDYRAVGGHEGFFRAIGELKAAQAEVAADRLAVRRLLFQIRAQATVHARVVRCYRPAAGRVHVVFDLPEMEVDPEPGAVWTLRADA